MSKKQGHTPGPWKINESVADDRTVVDLPNGNSISQSFYGGDSKLEREANAHLIAAAPDMLDALEHLDRIFTAENARKMGLELEHDEICRVIAGAKGESMSKHMEGQCEAGCKAFTGGEIHHHEDCVFYPESMSKIYDDMLKALKTLGDWPRGSEDCDGRLSYDPAVGLANVRRFARAAIAKAKGEA